MSAYLKYFELEQSPFEGKAQSQVVLGTKALRDAFAVIQSGLDEGDARICVSGGPGLGKTSLARALPKLLGNTARVAVVLDPDVSWESLRGSIAKQWGLASSGLARNVLVETARDHRLVIVIDQAERASGEFLDHLDIVLSYRSENDEPVVQSILMTRLTGNDAQEPAPIIWWLDRIQTLQLEFAPLPRNGVESYIRKHLKRAGWQGERIFTEEAALAIHGYTGGIPGEISQLCERLLGEAAARDLHDIDAAFIHSLCDAGEHDEVEPKVEDESNPTGGHDEIVLDEVSCEPDATTDADAPTIELTEAVAESEMPLEFVEAPANAEADEENAEEPADEDPDEDRAWSQADAALGFEDDALSAPPSPEELRAIHGSALGRHGRAFAAAAIAALIGGLAFAWLTTNTGPVKPIVPRNLELAGPDLAHPTHPTHLTEATEEKSPTGSEATETPLARLRGPVSMTANTPAAASEPDITTLPTGPEIFEISDEELEEAILANDPIDMRPASMLPGWTGRRPVQEPF